MDGWAFPSCGWPFDGEDGGVVPADEHPAGPSFLLPPVGGYSPAGLVQGQSPSPSSGSSSVGMGGSVEARAEAASRVHTMAERRRRERINGHLSTFRRMIPDATKVDKASLLAMVIREIRVLKKKAIDVKKDFMVPLDVNLVFVECIQSNEQANKGAPLIKASICCDDRPDLFTDIIEAFHGLRLEALRADIVSIGGRVQNVFLLCSRSRDGNACLSSLMESIKEVLGRVACIDELGSTNLSSKRRRFFQPHCSDVPF